MFLFLPFQQQAIAYTPFFSYHHGHQLFLSTAMVPLECCQSAKGLKVKEEKETNLGFNLS
jgi:hypothetical protein